MLSRRGTPAILSICGTFGLAPVLITTMSAWYFSSPTVIAFGPEKRDLPSISVRFSARSALRYAALRTASNDPVLAVDDLAERDLHLDRVDTEVDAASYQVCDFGGVQHRLDGDTPAVETGAPEDVLFDEHAGAMPGRPDCSGRARHATPDDDGGCVDRRHG